MSKSIGDILLEAGALLNNGSVVPATGITSTVDGQVNTPIVITQNSTSDQYEAFTVNIGPSPSVVINADPARNKVTIRNSGTNNVYIGKLGVVQSGTGFLLPAGASFNPETTAAVYAIAPSAAVSAPVPLSVWAERDA